MPNKTSSAAQGAKEPQEYPDQTRGSQLAAEIRQDANNLSEAQREELFRTGMQMIYGEPPVAESARTRQ